ncbi:MAG: glutamine amidotransferase [Planctomycetaceae bacterium]
MTALIYPRRTKHLPSKSRRWLMAFRIAVVVLLTILILRPAVVLKRQDKTDSVLYVLVDRSRSFQTTDAPGNVARREAALKTLQAAKEFIDQLKDKAEIRIRDFDEILHATEEQTPESDGKSTAIGYALDSLIDEAGRDRVSGVVMLSDGRQAALGSKDVDPLQPARTLGRQQRPVYTVVYGSSESSESGQDVALDELDLSRDVFKGNVVPIRVRLKCAGVLGQPVRVRVLLEDRSDPRLQLGQTGPMKPVNPTAQTQPIVVHTPTNPDDEVTISLNIVPEIAGDLKLAVEADVLPGELRQTNNRVETIIRVQQGGIRVAYFDILRWESRFLRAINVSNRVQIDFIRILQGPLAGKNRIPDSYFVPGEYDAFIIGNVPASAFEPGQLMNMQQCCLQGAGLMMTGGFENFGAGGYADTAIAPLLPVELRQNDQQLTDLLKMLPTRDGLAHYVMQIALLDRNRERWEQLPPLDGANLLKRRDQSAAQILAASAEGTPLLIGQSIGNSRVLAFAGDSTWQWAMQGFAEEHQRFWRQVIFWLTRKDADSDSLVWVNADPRDLSPGQPAELTFGARDSEGQPLADAIYTVEVTTPSGKNISVVPRKVPEGGNGEFSETLEAGDYWVKVAAMANGTAVGPTAVTRFNVNSRDPELDYPAADPDLMREIAHVSGGEYLTPDEMISRFEKWAMDGLPGMDLERTERITLWDNWLMLLLIISLLTIEWALRKKRGLV